ncbi:FAD-dependent oxidoreductase [Salinisphaera sp. USBA-960]|uniref:glycerol-3-phosphate dehydrogenase/oxidase n=1 Tax=Salinisphaera orenii TaxID=856731 RepID=UPI000DBE11F9|nr:FAD-dependent oxidoreductase [Salifodinibacter halophilus]NNC25740.1 FAD-dependent oxidoreductase [Salifodinibacter halophilus]
MGLRESNITQLKNDVYDVLVIGGGINGSVSAAALAGKGVKTGLIDAGDWAGMTSEHTSNLAWGGIKYMESYDFRLVRELCKSRNHLMHNYPSTVQEIRFLTTIMKGFRHHPLYLWAGTWLYWLMGNCFTRMPRLPSLAALNREEPIVDTSNATGCFEYSDAYLHDNDSRFVFNFVRLAMNSGCAAANYVESVSATRTNGRWQVQLKDSLTGETFDVEAKAIVNACGPLADDYNERIGVKTEHAHVLSKGIHIVVDQQTPNKRVLAFFDDDGRLFFVIPMGNRTCIGTTDTRTENPRPEVTDADVDFLLKNINERLTLDRPLARSDIISTRCGVRPLAVQADAGQGRDFLQLSRQHHIDFDADQAHLSIFGGKLTDCLNVGDEITERIASLGIAVPYPKYRWYGEPPDSVRDEFFHQARLMDLDAMTSAAASEPLSTRLWRRYAANAIGMLEKIREDPKQAEILIEGTEYLRCEVGQAAQREMVTKLEDFLRRRSKISMVSDTATIRQSDGLMEACRILFGDDAQARFDEYFVARGVEPSAEKQSPADAEPLGHNDVVAADGEVSEPLNW